MSEGLPDEVKQEEVRAAYSEKLKLAFKGRGARVVAFSIVIAPLLAITGVRCQAGFAGIAFALLLVLGLQLLAERDWVMNIRALFAKRPTE